MIEVLNKLDANMISGGYYVCESRQHGLLSAHEEFWRDANAIKDCCVDLGGGRLWNGRGYSCPRPMKELEPEVQDVQAGCRKPKSKTIMPILEEPAVLSVEAVKLSGQ